MTREERLSHLFTAAGDAVRFLTLLPYPRAPEPGEEAEGPGLHPWTMALFPVVGLFLGAVLWTAAMLLGWFFPVGVVDLVVLAALALVSGGLHWDALMDTADALGAPKEKRLEVLKDKHVGSFGLLALAFVAGGQWVGLFSLSGWVHGASILLFPIWGRWMMVVVTHGMADLREGEGLAADFISQLEVRHILWATGFAFVCSVLLLGLVGALVLMIGLGLAALGLRLLYQRVFGGVSGDLIGAACPIGELCALLMLSGVA